MSDLVIGGQIAPRPTLTVSLVGKEYKVRAPKTALNLAFATAAKKAADDPAVMMRVLMDWTKAAFGATKATEIRKRLDDADDDLDIEHLSDLIAKVTAATTGDPTT